LTGASCVWYATRVEPYQPWYADRPRVVVETRCQVIYVDDDSGSAVVRMERAEVRVVSMRDPWQDEAATSSESWLYETFGRPIETDDDRMVARTEKLRNFLQARGVPLHYRAPSVFEVLANREPRPSKRLARFREDVLPEGIRVAVLGRVWREPDPTAPPINMRQPAFRPVFGESPHGVIVSTEPDDC
jgi:hypothetical protein